MAEDGQKSRGIGIVKEKASKNLNDQTFNDKTDKEVTVDEINQG